MPREFGPQDYNAQYFGYDTTSQLSNYRHPYNELGIKKFVRYNLWSAHVYAELWAKFPQNTPLRVLDVGGATGLFAKHLKRFPRVDIFVADFSTWATRNTVNEMRGRNAQIDARHLPYSDDTFNSLVSFDMLEHIKEEDIPMTIQEMYRVLKPGGRGVIIANVGTEDFENDKSHITRRIPDWWKERFSEAGFVISQSLFHRLAIPLRTNHVLRDKLTFVNPGYMIVDKPNT